MKPLQQRSRGSEAAIYLSRSAAYRTRKGFDLPWQALLLREQGTFQLLASFCDALTT